MELHVKLFTTKAEGQTWSTTVVCQPPVKMPLLTLGVPSHSLSPREKDAFLRMPSFSSPLRFNPSLYYTLIVL